MKQDFCMSNIRPFTTFLMICLTAFSLSACQQEEVAETGEVIRPAKLIEITESSGIVELSFPAVVAAATSKDLAFQVSGQIEKINVKGGDEIKKGTLIAQLDQRLFRNDLQSAQTQYDSARIEFERAERLIEGNAISQSVFDQRKTQLDVAAASLDTAKKALDETMLYSPFDGIIATVQGKELEAGSPSQPTVTIQTVGAAEAIVKIPANLVAQSKQIVPLETVVILDAASDTSIEAEFYEASGIADATSQTFEVKFSFTPPDNLVVLPGMTGSVRSKIDLGQNNDQKQISVPLSAVQSVGDATYVWLVSVDEMTVSRRDISVSPSVGESLLVTNGLAAGDLIVGAGAAYLHEGMKIRRLEN